MLSEQPRSVWIRSYNAGSPIDAEDVLHEIVFVVVAERIAAVGRAAVRIHVRIQFCAGSALLGRIIEPIRADAEDRDGNEHDERKEIEADVTVVRCLLERNEHQQDLHYEREADEDHREHVPCGRQRHTEQSGDRKRDCGVSIEIEHPEEGEFLVHQRQRKEQRAEHQTVCDQRNDESEQQREAKAVMLAGGGDGKHEGEEQDVRSEKHGPFKGLAAGGVQDAVFGLAGEESFDGGKQVFENGRGTAGSAPSGNRCAAVSAEGGIIRDLSAAFLTEHFFHSLSFNCAGCRCTSCYYNIL